MAEKILYPSLSEDAWVTSPEKTADYLLSCFLVSNYSQSYQFHGLISSLPWILQQTQDDIVKACSEVRSALETLFSRYFSSVIVEVQEVPNPENESKQQMSIYVRFTDSTGTNYTLGKLLRMSNTVVEEIIAINNG